jgi:hypothetical protein
LATRAKLVANFAHASNPNSPVARRGTIRKNAGVKGVTGMKKLVIAGSLVASVLSLGVSGALAGPLEDGMVRL